MKPFTSLHKSPLLWGAVFSSSGKQSLVKMLEGAISPGATQRSGGKSRSSVLFWGLKLWHLVLASKILMMSKRHRWVYELRHGHGDGRSYGVVYFPPGRKQGPFHGVLPGVLEVIHLVAPQVSTRSSKLGETRWPLKRGCALNCYRSKL